MLDDRDEKKYDGSEESEYHFSDDDVSYEVETEAKTPAAETQPKLSLGERLSQSRRGIIGVVIFLVLVLIVYKMVMPSSTTPPTNITNVPVTTAQQTPPTQTQTVPTVQPGSSFANTQPGAVIPVQGPSQNQAPAFVAPAQPVGISLETQQKLDQMQADYTQKVNDLTAQNQTLQGQVQGLTTRLSTMEAELNQLIKVLTRQAAQGATADMTAAVQAQVSAQSVYSVQAIIPGRAWLRSDTGETLTVAEGDMVPSVGRVTKIDPYNGVVVLNTGTKTISLSYGNGSGT